MRVMMALLLGLYLVVPARAADGGPVLLLPGALSLRHRMTGWPEMPEASRRGARPLYRVPQLRRGRPLRTALQRRGRPAR